MNFSALFVLLVFAGTSNADFSYETRKLISDWAPLIWIHSEDPFLPSNVDFYLENMEVGKVFCIRNYYSISVILYEQ